MAHAAPTRTPIVHVFIPPPVEPGDAPINISSITNTSVATLKSPTGRVLKPAVLGVTEWKAAPSIFSFCVIPARVLFSSRTNMASAPRINRIRVTLIAILL